MSVDLTRTSSMRGVASQRPPKLLSRAQTDSERRNIFLTDRHQAADAERVGRPAAFVVKLASGLTCCGYAPDLLPATGRAANRVLEVGQRDPPRAMPETGKLSECPAAAR